MTPHEERKKFFEKRDFLWNLLDEISKKKRELVKELLEFKAMFKKEQEKELPDGEATYAKVLIASIELEIKK